MIETRALTRRFGSLIAVSEVSVCWPQVGLVGLLGPNGAGKTSLLRMLAGALAATEGEIRVCGIDLFEHPMKARAKIGFLPENPPLHLELTVGEYLRFAGELRGMHRPWLAIGRWMERLALQGLEKQRIGSLSKGLRQRVGLVQALLHDPAVLLLDEPTSGLDPLQLIQFREVLREVSERSLVVWSTHLLTEVEDGSTLAFLHGGRLIAEGTAAQLRKRASQTEMLRVLVDETPVGLEARLLRLPILRRLDRVEGGWECDIERHDLDVLTSEILASGAKLRELSWDTASLESTFAKLVST